MTLLDGTPTLIAPSPAAHDAAGNARSYEVRTFGCQMNVHDSERLSGSLESAGYVRAAAGEEADVVIINTCAVRDNAAGKLYGTLGHLASIKRRKDGMQIAVGGCLAQMDKQTVLDKAPWVDVVFGTHNMGSLPSLLERARHNGEAELEILESLEVFPSTLPTKRDSIYSGWVSISVGCNNTCTFCIVPSLRGKEKDRRPGDILNEIRLLVDDGAIEVTLLGQNVNSYGVEFGDRLAFGKLLRAAGEIEGLERIRFTSPHPAAFTDDVIDAMAETPSVMPQLHMPLQSGSDRILRAMRRSYRSERFLGILDRVRERMPERRHHDRHHRRLPRRDRRRLRRHPAGRRAGAFHERLHLPVLDPRGHSRGDDARSGAQGGRAGALQPSARAAGAHLARGEPGAGRPRGRGARLDGRGQEGCGDAPADRPCGRQPPRALRAARRQRRTAPGRRRLGAHHARGSLPPAGRRAGRCTAAHPPHPRGRRVGSIAGRVLRRPGGVRPTPARRAPCRSGCPPSARRALGDARAPAPGSEPAGSSEQGSARAAAVRGRRCHRHRQERSLPRSRRSPRRLAGARRRWSTPTRCSCTGAWTSEPPSSRWPSAAASRITCSTCSMSRRTPRSPATRAEARAAIEAAPRARVPRDPRRRVRTLRLERAVRLPLPAARRGGAGAAGGGARGRRTRRAVRAAARGGSRRPPLASTRATAGASSGRWRCSRRARRRTAPPFPTSRCSGGPRASSACEAPATS